MKDNISKKKIDEGRVKRIWNNDEIFVKKNKRKNRDKYKSKET